MTSKILLCGAVVLLGLHGVIHLIGTVVYLQVAELDGFAYKTTLMGGRLDLGDWGIRLFGALWLVPAIGFMVAAQGLWTGWPLWLPVLVGSALCSLVLTSVDWNVAFMGAITDGVILLLLPLARYLPGV